MDSSKAKKAGSPRNAPKVKAPSRKNPNYMKENIPSQSKGSAQWPMKSKRLSK